MNFQEIKTKLKKLKIKNSDLIDNFEEYCDKNLEVENNTYSINIFNQTICECDLNILHNKIDKILYDNFGEINIKSQKINSLIEVVIHFIKHDIFILIKGKYDYYLSEYEDEIQECIPTQKTITIYKEI